MRTKAATKKREKMTRIITETIAMKMKERKRTLKLEGIMIKLKMNTMIMMKAKMKSMTKMRKMRTTKSTMKRKEKKKAVILT